MWIIVMLAACLVPALVFLLARSGAGLRARQAGTFETSAVSSSAPGDIIPWTPACDGMDDDTKLFAHVR